MKGKKTVGFTWKWLPIIPCKDIIAQELRNSACIATQALHSELPGTSRNGRSLLIIFLHAYPHASTVEERLFFTQNQVNLIELIILTH